MGEHSVRARNGSEKKIQLQLLAEKRSEIVTKELDCKPRIKLELELVYLGQVSSLSVKVAVIRFSR